MRQAISELLDFVDDVVDDLGSHREMYYIRQLLEDPSGTGADRQVAVYQKTGGFDAVMRYLLEETMKGIPLFLSEEVPAD